MNGFDAGILHFLNHFARHSWSFDVLMGVIAESEIVVRTVPGIFASLLISRTLSMFLVPFRLRPMANPELGFVLPYEPPTQFLERLSSFPSDHAVLFAALVVPVVLAARRHGFWLAPYTVLVILLPRVYVGLHSPPDVLAGAVIGVGTAYLSYRLVPPHAVSTVLSWPDRYPTRFYAGAFLVAFETADLFESTRRLGRFALEASRDLRHLPPRSGGLVDVVRHYEPLIGFLGVLITSVALTAVAVSVLRRVVSHRNRSAPAPPRVEPSGVLTLPGDPDDRRPPRPPSRNEDEVATRS